MAATRGALRDPVGRHVKTGGGAVQIGAEGVVLHTGSGVDEGGDGAGLHRVREGLLPLLDGPEVPGSRDVGDTSTRLLRELRAAAGPGRTA